MRELNRATLARQLLLERKRLPPTAVVERLRAEDSDAVVAKYPCCGSVVEHATGIIVPRPAVAALTAAARGRLTG